VFQNHADQLQFSKSYTIYGLFEYASSSQNMYLRGTHFCIYVYCRHDFKETRGCLKRIQTTHMSYKIIVDHRDSNTSTVISNIHSTTFAYQKKTNLKLQIKVKIL